MNFNQVTRNKNMNLSITTRFIAFALAVILALGLSLTPVFAAHPDEDMTSHSDEIHSDEGTHEGDDSEDSPRITQMKTLVAVLAQLIELLQQQADMSDEHVHDDSHEHESDTEGLTVWVEIHSNKTHAHVQEAGKDLVTFFVDDIPYSDETGIVAAIAEETGISSHEIEEVIVFPSGEVNENGDSTEEGEHHEDIHGIHIMNDGTIMNGDGEEVHGATITDDGMIMLEDGDIVEPEFDLR
ncbi:MAG: hypothetical protein ACI9BF_000647 [Candidatus Paceibacteria bacterium]